MIDPELADALKTV